MSDYATKDEVQEIVTTAVNKAVDDLSGVIRSFAQDVDDRFSAQDKEINSIKSDVADLNEKYDRLLNTIDSFIARIDTYETENKARDAQIARLERWIEQIADKTGVKLEL